MKKEISVPAHIYGSAPSVSIVKKLDVLGIKIAVGDMPWRAKDLGPFDFWVTNNTYFPIPWNSKDKKIIKRSKSITLISTSCVNNPSAFIPNNLNKILEKMIIRDEIILYDAQHFKGDSRICYDQPCCTLRERFKPGLTIQEELSQKFNLLKPAYKIGHATINAISLALLLNCNPIYVHGVELPNSTREYKYYKRFSKIAPRGWKARFSIILNMGISILKNKQTDFSGETRRQLLSDFESVGILAASANINLYSTSKRSPLNYLNGYKYLNIE